MINIKRKKFTTGINKTSNECNYASPGNRKMKNTHAVLGKKWHKEDTDNEKEASPEEKSVRKISYKLPNKYHEQFNVKSNN